MHEVGVEINEEHAPLEGAKLTVSLLIHIQEHLEDILVELLISSIVSE